MYHLEHQDLTPALQCAPSSKRERNMMSILNAEPADAHMTGPIIGVHVSLCMQSSSRFVDCCMQPDNLPGPDA